MVNWILHQFRVPELKMPLKWSNNNHESIPHKNSSSKQAQQQEQKVQSPQSNSSLLENKYGAIRKVVNTQTKKEQVQLDPTQYGAIRKVLNTKAKMDQNQQNCNQYVFIRNVGIFSSIGCFLNFQHFSQPKKDYFLNFPENITCIYFKNKKFLNRKFDFWILNWWLILQDFVCTGFFNLQTLSKFLTKMFLINQYWMYLRNLKSTESKKEQDRRYPDIKLATVKRQKICRK